MTDDAPPQPPHAGRRLLATLAGLALLGVVMTGLAIAWALTHGGHW